MKRIRNLAFAAICMALSSNAVAANFDDGELLFDQPGWDYSPSAMLDMDGKEKVWWCGHQGGHDVIKYRERTATGPWSAPQIVLQSNMHLPAGKLDWEGTHTCDPSVTRGTWNYFGKTYTYALYYTTERPGTAGIDNRIGVAFSNDGKIWFKHGAPVINEGITGTYGSGQSVAWSADGGAGVRTIYTFVDSAGAIKYYYREAADGINFGPRRELSQAGLTLNGVPAISNANPAIGFAPGTYQNRYFYYLVNVCETHGNSPNGPLWGSPKAVCVYRAEGEDAFTGTWTRVLDSTHVKPVEVEPGFLTNLYGSLDGLLPNISVNHGCSGSGDPNTWEICWYEGTQP